MIKHDGSLKFKFSRNLLAFRSSMSLLEIVDFAEVLKHYFRRNRVINNEEKKDKISLYCVCNGQVWEVEIKNFNLNI